MRREHREGFDDPVLPRGGQVVSRAGQSRRGPEQPSERIGGDLDVHAVAFVLPGVAGVAAPQVGQGEQGLTCGGKVPPPRPDLLPTGCQLSGQEPQGMAGQINRGRVDMHAKLVAGAGDLGREPVYQELLRCAGLSNSRSAPSAWKGLTVSRACRCSQARPGGRAPLRSRYAARGRVPGCPRGRSIHPGVAAGPPAWEARPW